MTDQELRMWAVEQAVRSGVAITPEEAHEFVTGIGVFDPDSLKGFLRDLHIALSKISATLKGPWPDDAAGMAAGMLQVVLSQLETFEKFVSQAK